MDRIERKNLEKDLAEIINKYSLENESNTPDFILAEHLVNCIDNFNKTVRHRASWYGRIDAPAQGSIPFKVDCYE